METDYLNYGARKFAEESLHAFQKQSLISQISSIALVIWVIGGLFNDGSFYVAGFFFTAVFYVLSIIEVLSTQQRIESIKKQSFRRTVWGWIAYWLYSSVGKSGPSVATFLGYSFDVDKYTPFAIGVYLIVWFGTRYLNPAKWASDLSEDKIAVLLLQGITKGVILIAFFFSLTKNNNISSDYYIYVLIAYLLDPVFAGTFAYLDDVYSSSSMMQTDSKLPGSAIRDVLLTDFLILLITGGYDHQLALAIGDLRVLYLFALLIAFFNAQHSAAEYLQNPLKKSTLGGFVSDLQDELKDNVTQYSETYMARSKLNVDLNQASAMGLDPGALLIPLEEGRKMVKAVIVGKGQNILKQGKHYIPQAIDGITATQIPKKQYQELINQMQKTSLQEVNFADFGLPSLQELEYMLDDLAQNINMWVTKAKQHLTRFNASGYGVYDSKELTKVNLPEINVIESKGLKGMPKFTRVKIASFISVLDEGRKGKIVQLPGLHVIDKPKFTFVDLPFITVFDLHDKESKQKGTMVNIFGFRVGDRLDASKLDFIRELMLKNAKDQLSSFDMNFEQILRDKNSVPIFNLAANGTFRPLLTSQSTAIGNHIALPESSQFIAELPSATPSQKALESATKDAAIDADYEILDE